MFSAEYVFHFINLVLFVNNTSRTYLDPSLSFTNNSCLKPTYRQCICDCICVQHKSIHFLSGHLFNIREIEKYPLYEILAVTTCPPLQLADGEVCDDKSCTTERKFYGDHCTVSDKIGNNPTTTNECTQHGSWSEDDTRERRMCNRDSPNRLLKCIVL